MSEVTVMNMNEALDLVDENLAQKILEACSDHKIATVQFTLAMCLAQVLVDSESEATDITIHVGGLARFIENVALVARRRRRGDA
jgi:hypothetical protein